MKIPNTYNVIFCLILMLGFMHCNPEQDQYKNQTINADKITIKIKELKVDKIPKNENPEDNNTDEILPNREKDLEEYVHYILDIHIPVSQEIKDPGYLNFEMENDIRLECRNQSNTPVLYINEGDLPGRNGINRIVVAFNKLECNDKSRHLIKIDSKVIGLFEIEI